MTKGDRQTHRQENRQAEKPIDPSHRCLCFPYLNVCVCARVYVCVSSSALHSEQGFQGHLAGCRAWC